MYYILPYMTIPPKSLPSDIRFVFPVLHVQGYHVPWYLVNSLIFGHHTDRVLLMSPSPLILKGKIESLALFVIYTKYTISLLTFHYSYTNTNSNTVLVSALHDIDSLKPFNWRDLDLQKYTFHYITIVEAKSNEYSLIHQFIYTNNVMDRDIRVFQIIIMYLLISYFIRYL